jgi:hypothetical protein
MTAAQLLTEYAPPPLFHGRHWGSWVLDTERVCLVFQGQPVMRGGGGSCPQYLAFLGRYEIDIEQIRHSAAMLDWIYQVNKKAWATARVTKDLVNAFDDVFHPQASLCSGGSDKIIQNPTAFLRHRFATIGKNSPLGEAA